MSDLKQAHHALAGTVAATTSFALDLLLSARNVEGLPSEAASFIQKTEGLLEKLVKISEQARLECETVKSKEANVA